MGIADPRDIPGLVAWYSAEAETGYADGDEMTQWTDLSGNGNHAVATNIVQTGAAKPRWKATAGGSGGPAVRFTQSEVGYFTLPTNLMGSATSGEIMATLKSGVDSGLWFFGQTGGSQLDAYYPYQGVVYDNFGLSGGQRKNFTPTLTVSSWRRYNAWSAANDWAARLDGVTQLTSTTATVAWPTQPLLGRTEPLSGSLQIFDGHMGAVVLYDRKLTTTERADLDAWLAANPSGGAPSVPLTYEQEVLADSPLGYWRMDEPSGTTMLDSSGNSRDGAYVGSVALGKAGLVWPSRSSAAAFSGGARGSLSYDPVWMAPAAFTYEAWFTATGVTGYQHLIGRVDSAAYSTAMRLNGNMLEFICDIGSYQDLTYAGLVAGTRYHAVVTHDGATLRMYLNGAQVASRALSGTFAAAATTPMSVGANGDGGEALSGVVDEVAYYGAALSAARVQAHYDTGIAGPTDGYDGAVLADAPLAYYRLGEASGTTMLDSSGNGRSGTYSGAYTLAASGLLAGDTDTAVDFGGGQGIVASPGSWLNASQAITVEAVVSPDTVTGNDTIARHDADASPLSECGFGFRLNAGKPEAFISNGTALVYATAANALAVGGTYHVVARYDGTNLKVFVDGVEVATAASASRNTASTQDLYVGDAWAGDQQFDGRIDEVAIYGAALTATQIATHAALAKGIQAYDVEVLADAPLAYYRLDDTSGAILADASGNGRDGTYPSVSGVSFSQPGLLAGDPNVAVAFAGSGGRAAVPYDASWMVPINLTVEAIFKPGTLSGRRIIVAHAENSGGASSSNYSFQLEWNGTSLTFNLFTTAGYPPLTVNAGLVLGTTYHVAATWDGSTVRLYLDGRLIGSLAQSGAMWAASNWPLTIGADGGGSFLRTIGTVDEVAFYGTALSADRVQAHSLASKSTVASTPPPTDGAVTAPVGQVVESATARRMGIRLGVRQVVATETAQAVRALREPDDFGLARVITGSDGAYTHDMSSHSLEVGEPNPNGATKTSWFQWTAPDDSDGLLQRFHTRGSNVDTSLAIYTGTALDALTEVAISDDSSGDDADLKFAAVGGQTYMIQVGSKTDPATSVVLSWLSGEPEEYDAFTTPMLLESDYGSAEFTLDNGTVEPGEPVPAGTIATSWLRWDSDTDQPITFTVRGFDTTLYTVRVYYGTTFGDLTLVTEVSGTGQQQATIAPPVVGRTYYIQLSSGDDVSPGFEIAWSVQAAPVEPFPLPIPTAADPAPQVPLHAMLYEADNTFVTEIPRRMGVSLQEPLNIVGVGAMSVALTDPIMEVDNDLLRWGRVVKFFLGTKCIHAFMIKERITSYVKSDEYTGFIVTVGGPSVHFMLDHFIVRHDGDPRPDSLSSRFYSWASKPGEWYNATDWDAVVHQNSMDDPPSNKKKKKPKNWKVKEAKWIWHPGPYKYFRKTINIREDGTLVRIFATADEWYRVYLDGEQILDDRNVEIGYTKYKKIETTLSKGKHTFAALVRGIKSANIGDGNDSFLFAMCKIDLDGKIIKPPLLVSDKTWECHIGNPPPGWNRAQVLRNVVKEARQRGVEAANRLTFGFDGDVDSDGKPWPNVQFNQEVQIGTSALDLQSQLSEGNGFDVWVNPEDFTLEAWKRRGKDKSASVTLEPGRNLLDWEVREKDEALNKWLIQYDGGWTEYDAKGSQEDLEIRESFVSLGSVKDEKSARNLMKRVAQSIAKAQERAGTGDVRKRPVKQPDGGLIGVVGAYPFLDFETGDVVSGPNRKGRLVPIRVMSLSLTEDPNGDLSFDPELEVV